MTVNKIFDFLNRLFPVSDALSFDNVGLLVGDGGAEVKKALICLDCTPNAVEKAKKEDCNLIITHHPVIFSPIKKLTAESITYKLINSKISVISMHTNLDIAEGGVNFSLCKAVGLKNIESVTAGDGFTLKSGEIPPISADDFAEHLKATLKGAVKYVDGGKKITRVLVCSGSGGDYLDEAASLGFNALLTADVKHHQFLAAAQNGLSLFDAGHFNTEDVVVEPLKELLSAEFKDLEFITSHHSDIKAI